MLGSLTSKQLQTLQQTLALLRSQWRLIKAYAAQTNEEYPLTTNVGLFVLFLLSLWMISSVKRPERLEKELGLPVISGSRTLEKDFVAVIERGRQMVSRAPLRQLIKASAHTCSHAN